MTRQAPDESLLHTTTVRFDADLWRRLCAIADRLGVARAALIRAAVREYVARIEREDRLTLVEGQLDGLMSTVGSMAGRLRRVEQYAKNLAGRLRHA